MISLLRFSRSTFAGIAYAGNPWQKRYHSFPIHPNLYLGGIADNKIALNATWDERLLVKDLHSLQTLDLELELTGFNTVEIDKLMAAHSFG